MNKYKLEIKYKIKWLYSKLIIKNKQMDKENTGFTMDEIVSSSFFFWNRVRSIWLKTVFLTENNS